jgi:DNA-binding CsgD family transcriptional regulator
MTDRVSKPQESMMTAPSKRKLPLPDRLAEGNEASLSPIDCDPIDRPVVRRMGPQKSPALPPRPRNELSSREREVLHWLAIGKSGLDIALILGISICTVRLHIQSIKRKLGACNIPHAVARGYDTGVFAASTDETDTSASRTDRSAAAKEPTAG